MGYPALDGSTVLEGDYGWIKLNADGSYTYTLTVNIDGPTADNGANTIDNAEAFAYTVTDANDNTSSSTVYINVIDDIPGR